MIDSGISAGGAIGVVILPAACHLRTFFQFVGTVFSKRVAGDIHVEMYTTERNDAGVFRIVYRAFITHHLGM